jgi:hypothetical protein
LKEEAEIIDCNMQDFGIAAYHLAGLCASLCSRSTRSSRRTLIFRQLFRDRKSRQKTDCFRYLLCISPESIAIISTSAHMGQRDISGESWKYLSVKRNRLNHRQSLAGRRMSCSSRMTKSLFWMYCRLQKVWFGNIAGYKKSCTDFWSRLLRC